MGKWWNDWEWMGMEPLVLIMATPRLLLLLTVFKRSFYGTAEEHLTIQTISCWTHPVAELHTKYCGFFLRNKQWRRHFQMCGQLTMWGQLHSSSKPLLQDFTKNLDGMSCTWNGLSKILGESFDSHMVEPRLNIIYNKDGLQSLHSNPTSEMTCGNDLRSRRGILWQFKQLPTRHLGTEASDEIGDFATFHCSWTAHLLKHRRLTQSWKDQLWTSTLSQSEQFISCYSSVICFLS